MACEKYSSWIMDAALDALPPERSFELTVHAQRCSSCRESLEKARALMASIDGGVKALVSSEPSPQFEAKVRTRLAAEKSPRVQPRLQWIPVGALGAVLVAAVSIAIVHEPKKHLSEVHVPEPAGGNSRPAAKPANNQILLTGRTSPAEAQDRGSNMKSAPAKGVLAAKPRPLMAVGNRQPEVLVQPGQFALIGEFANGVRSGQIDGHQAVEFEQQSESGALLEIAPVDIAPLAITAITDPQELDSGS